MDVVRCTGADSPASNALSAPIPGARTLSIPRTVYRPDDVVRHILPNGLTLLVRVDRSAPVVAIVTDVRAGYFDETDDIIGIAHVLEHMYFKGTPTRGVGEIARQTKAAGGYLNASTIYDHTRYYAVVPSSGFGEGLAIQADAFLNSAIDADELRRELEVIIQEAGRKADNPGAVTTETLFEVLHDHHRIRRWRIGREAGLRALTRDDVHRFYRTYYQPEATVLSVVGDVAVADVIQRVEQWYGTLPAGTVPRAPGPQESGPPGRRYRRLTGDVTTWHATFGWRTPGADHADTVALDLAASVLGAGRASRLYRAIREPGLATSVAAWNYTPTELGVFCLDLEGEPGQTTGALSEAWAQLRGLHHGIHDSEVERVQMLHHAQLMRRLETMEGQANWLADWESQGGWERGLEHAEQVRTTSADDLRRVVTAYLDPAQASLVLFEPNGATPWAVDADDVFRRLDERPAASPLVRPAAVPSTAAAKVRVERVATHREISVFRAPNGLPVLVRRRPGSTLVQVSVHALLGAVHDPLAMRGIGHLLTKTALQGTESRSAAALALAAEGLGARLMAGASADALDWGISAPVDALYPAADLLAELVLRPALEASALERERQIARAQLRQERDDMYRYPMRLAMTAAWEGHPYSYSAVGTDEGLGAVTREALQAWHARLLTDGGSLLAVTGDVDPEAVASDLAGRFASLAPGAVPAVPAATWTTPDAPVTESRDKTQSALVMAFPAPSRRDDTRVAGDLLVGVCSGLGGRFFDELRDRQSLAYTVALSQISRDAGGTIVAYIATDPAKEDAARQGLLHQVERLRAQAVDSEELERARVYALGTRAIASQGSAFLHGEMIDAWAHGSGLEDIDRASELLRRASVDDLQAFAVRWMNPALRVEGVVRGRSA